MDGRLSWVRRRRICCEGRKGKHRGREEREEKKDKNAKKE